MKFVVNARFLTQPITGTQRFAIELSLKIKDAFPEATFLTSDRVIHSELAEKLNAKIVGKSKNGLLWEQFELPIILKSMGSPLLLNLCNIAPVLYNNNIVSILDLSFHHHPEWFSLFFRSMYNYIVPKIAKKAKHIITISKYSKDDIIQTYNINEEGVSIIFPSIPGAFLSKNLDLHTEKSSYEKGSYILAVSSLDPRKNFTGLIRAFLKSGLDNIKLVIVGAQNKVFANSDLREMVAGKNNIIFTGYVSDSELISLYKGALFFAYPSFFEGFGIPPLEAMSCGCPTLVSDTTSLPEVSKDASYYVDPHDINSITQGLKTLSYDYKLRQQLISDGFKRFSFFEKIDPLPYIVEILRKCEKSI